MITGQVTVSKEAVVEIRVRNAAVDELSVQAVVDTGFTGYLTLPPDVIAALGLPCVNRVPMYLAGDIKEEFDVHDAWIEWDGSVRRVLCLAAEGVALVGMSLLRGYRLTVDGVDGGPVTIERL